MDFEATKDILLNKKSMVKVQNAFMEEFVDIFKEATDYEKDFMQSSIDQIYKKFYYSLIDMEGYITPANILESLAFKEKVGPTVFFPKVQILENDAISCTLESTLHIVSSQDHHIVNDFEKVIEICKEGIRVDRFGIPHDSERERFKGKLFYDDRHYLNILILVAISIQYISIFTQGKKILAITTQKAKKLSELNNIQKIEIIIDGVIENCINSFNTGDPELNGILSKEMLYDILKNPAKFVDFIDHINENIGFDKNFIEDIIGKEETMNFHHIEELLQNNPAVSLVRLVSIQLDVYFFTPLGYYMQLIKPIYKNIYNIALELGHVFGALNESFNYGRNMLFAIPSEFDLTLLGDEVLLHGIESDKKQKIPKRQNDSSLLKLFAKRDKYLNDELINFLGSAQEFYDNYDDEFGYYDDDDYDEEYDDEYDDEYGDEYEEEYDDEGDRELKSYSNTKNNNKIIDMSSYKRKMGDNKKKSNKNHNHNDNNNNVYVLKIKNFYFKRSWIQVEISGEVTLDDLSSVVMREFDLEDGHLYSFFMSGKFWDRDSEYSHPLAEGYRSADQFAIGALGIVEKSKFAYVYDYGDEFRFEIECMSVGQIGSVDKDSKDSAKIIKRSKGFLKD